MADTTETGGGQAKGKGSWAPTRGYFEVKVAGGAAGARPAAKKAAPKKPAADADPVAAEAVAAKPAAAPAGPAVAAAAPKAAAKPKEAVKAAPVVQLDPLRDSVTTVEPLAESVLGKTMAAQIYDPPDSETTLYRVGALNALFAISSLLLLVVTIMVIWQDYDKDWKNIQRDWNEQVTRRYETELKDTLASQTVRFQAEEPRLAAILNQLAPNDAAGIVAALPAEVGSPQRMEALLREVRSRLPDDLETRRSKLKQLETEVLLLDKKVKFFRGDLAEGKFRLDEQKRHLIDKLGDTEAARAEIASLSEKYNKEFTLKLEGLEGELELKIQERDIARAALESQELESTRIAGPGETGGYTIADARKAYAEVSRTVRDSQKRVEAVDANWRNVARNMVLLDFMAPSYKIEKAVLDDLKEDLNFLKVGRVDRCKTCHVNIDSPEPSTIFAEIKVREGSDPLWGSVYRSHPRLDLFVGSSSPHPYEKFGCTICHQGDGHATDFITAAHTPQDHHQAEHWEKTYGWKPLHHQDYPMLAKKYVSSQCMKCHAQEHNLDGGSNFNLGYEVIKTYGCHGCHKIPIFAGFDKVGPDLSQVADKADVNWLYKWIRNPGHFRPTTRMPRFFDLTNSKGKMLSQDQKGVDARPVEIDFDVRNGVEAMAIATWLGTTGTPRNDLRKLTVEGDVTRGRALFLQSGCLGCHSVRRESLSGDKVGEDLLAIVTQANAALATSVSALPGSTAAEQARARQVGAAADRVKAALLALHQWYEDFTVGKNVEGLYHEVAARLEELVQLDETLGGDAGVAVTVKAAARSIYERWIHNTFAPDLSSIGSKVKSRDWLADWIADPRKHDPNTTMPRLRLEEGEGGEQALADVVAYLMTLRDPGFEAASVPDIATNPVAATVLRDLAFDYKRRLMSRARATEAVDAMAVDDQLRFVGHRLVRRYGCFGCHNGISNMEEVPEQDATGQIVKDEFGMPRKVERPGGNFNKESPIGAELTTWGIKLSAFLDFGYWGHQHSGREAVHHDRYSWATAKLTDTRRFDVIPAEKLIAEGQYEYVPTNRLIQKSTEELLKMPRFPFAHDGEQVQAVVNILAGLVLDPSTATQHIALDKMHRLSPQEQLLEDGSRLLSQLNCQGCHRLGGETQHVNVASLPTFSQYSSSPEDQRRGELEKETWLAKDLRLYGYHPDGKNLPEGRQLPPQPVYPNKEAQVVAHEKRLLKKGTLLNRSIYDTQTMAFDPETLEPADGEEPVSVVEMARGPINPESKLQGHFKAQELLNPHSHVLPVAGFEEGRMRFYFGGSDELGGVEQRPLGPPPLVRQGERVRSDWLFKFLLNVEPIRPWLKVRMPSFNLTPEQARLIAAWFKANSGLPEANEVFEDDTYDEALAQNGKALFGPTVGEKVGLQCNGCHPAGDQLPTVPSLDPPNKFDFRPVQNDIPGDSHSLIVAENGRLRVIPGFKGAAAAKEYAQQNLAGKEFAVCDPWNKLKWGPDLFKARDRLRPTWMRDWLQNPPDFMPGTSMPNFFGDRHPIRGAVLEDVHAASAEKRKIAEEKITSLLQYLVHMKLVEGGSKADD